MLGFGPDELPDRIEEWQKLTEAQDREPAFAALRAHSGPNGTCAQEMHVRCKDGSLKRLAVRGGLLDGTDGSPQRLVGTATDITSWTQGQGDAELQRVSERLQVATRAANLGIWDWDVVRDEVTWDDGMYRLYGVRKGDFHGAYDAWAKVLAPEDLERATANVQAALHGQRQLAMEFRVVWPDGSVHFIGAAGQTFRDGNGRPVRMVGVNYDMTEYRLAEQKLRWSEEQLRLLLDSTPEGFFGIDLQGQCTFCNAASLRLLGYQRPAELVGRDMDTLLAYQCLDGRPYPKEECPIVESLLTASPVVERHDVFRRKDGTSFPAEYGAFPLIREGRHVGAVVTFRDISERKRVEDALHERQRELEEAQRLANVGSWVWDVEPDVVTWSKQLYLDTGRDPTLPAPSYRKELPELYLPESWARLKAAVERALQTGAPYELQLQQHAPAGGEPRWIAARGEVVRDGCGRIVKLRGTSQDITERKAIEDEIRALNADLERRVAARTPISRRPPIGCARRARPPKRPTEPRAPFWPTCRTRSGRR